ncbi:MAG: sulfotransferase [Gemmataceae bacterium]|nr:sulfotransferase [Gemmataceae bacterium]
MPIYICGLARAGSTLLHEAVAAHAAVATHRIKDFPLIFTPCWWRRAAAGLRPRTPHERPHGDRIMITTDSPDALEEMLWMAFFPRCHDPTVCHVLPAGARHPEFESFYEAHLRKLLLAERKDRYAAKANYHVARLAYFVRLFPDARFIIPVRGPESLLRQQQRFSKAQRNNRRALAIMRRSGHFEFGLDRRPMNLGDPARLRQISAAWSTGDEIRGFALHWAMVYDHLDRLLAADERVRSAALVVRFEDLCAAPADTLRAALGFCMLPDAESVVQQFAPRISFPDYYKSGLSDGDRDVIRAATDDAARRWGY